MLLWMKFILYEMSKGWYLYLFDYSVDLCGDSGLFIMFVERSLICEYKSKYWVF